MHTIRKIMHVQIYNPSYLPDMVIYGLWPTIYSQKTISKFGTTYFHVEMIHVNNILSTTVN